MSKRVCFKISDESSRQLAAFRAIHEDSDSIDTFIETKINEYVKKINVSRGVQVNLESKLCPSCKSPMVKRKKDGRAFFGCTSFPKCKKTLGIKTV